MYVFFSDLYPDVGIVALVNIFNYVALKAEHDHSPFLVLNYVTLVISPRL